MNDDFLMALVSAIQQPRQSDNLPMRLPYGQRYNDASGKLDSKDAKSFGFYGPLKVPSGDIASEYSGSAPINGKTVDYPNIFPGMNQKQLAEVLMAAHLHQPVSPQTSDAAYDSAANRVSKGKNPFWDPRVDPFPRWSPEQDWPKR
jgi:hypothetical protein